MRSREEVALVLALAAEGYNLSQIARRVGVSPWRRSSVARRASVALLDEFVGPKS
jgi:hypothetical protein